MHAERGAIPTLILLEAKCVNFRNAQFIAIQLSFYLDPDMRSFTSIRHVLTQKCVWYDSGVIYGACILGL